MTLNKRINFLLIIFSFLINFSFSQEKYVTYGIATYYSDAFQGRKTTSGESYNKILYTAAHATLPFQTLVKITNLKNNISVVVKINDRCPKYCNRIIDLSKAAAKKLEIINSGIANVKLQVITAADLNMMINTPDSVFKMPVSDTTGSSKNILKPRKIYMTGFVKNVFSIFKNPFFVILYFS